MEWMLMPLKRYADFSGRSRRQEYWLFVLGQIIVFAALITLFIVLLPSRTEATPGLTPQDGPAMLVLALFFLFWLGLIIPTLAVQVRRFHDQDQSGWMILIQFIPGVGGIIMLVLMCMEGTRGPNRFGPDPVPGNAGEPFR